jgi:hypothetical protein
LLAVTRVLTAAERRELDRQHALGDALSSTTDGLSHYGERAIRSAVMRHLDPILDLADSATAARLEYEAIDRQLDVHVRELHPGCTIERPCPRFRLLRARRSRLLKAWDKAYGDLVRGRR